MWQLKVTDRAGPVPSAKWWYISIRYKSKVRITRAGNCKHHMFPQASYSFIQFASFAPFLQLCTVSRGILSPQLNVFQNKLSAVMLQNTWDRYFTEGYRVILCDNLAILCNLCDVVQCVQNLDPGDISNDYRTASQMGSSNNFL